MRRIVWGSDTDIYWHDDWDFSHYSRKVERETSWIRNGLNEQLEKSGWPTLTPQEIKGILSDNTKRQLKIV